MIDSPCWETALEELPREINRCKTLPWLFLPLPPHPPPRMKCMLGYESTKFDFERIDSVRLILVECEL